MRALATVTLLLLTGCSTAPISVQEITPQAPDDAFSCAMSQLNALGYTVENADRESGFIRGRKQTSGAAAVIFTGSNYHDALTVAVFEDQSTEDTVLRVTASRIQEDAWGLDSGNETGVAPSDSGEADANSILETCAEGVEGVSGRLDS